LLRDSAKHYSRSGHPASDVNPAHFQPEAFPIL
jgi:hypothetical protein